MEPTRERLVLAYRAGASYEDQECRLKSVLSLIAVGECHPTNPQYHLAMALYQSTKRLIGHLAFTCREPFEQLAIGQARNRADIKERAERLERGSESQAPHRV